MQIGSVDLTGERTFVIAEACANHNGDIEMARELVDVAAESGADAVKFQTIQPTDLIHEDSDGIKNLRRLTLSRADLEMLARYAEEQGIIFLSTPFDAGSATLLDELGIEAFKIGSGEIDNYPLLEHIAEFGRPMIVSTGMATRAEIREAERRITAISADVDLAFLHCVSAYPTDIADANLRMMQDIDDLVAGPVGFSDHTREVGTLAYAAAMGADIVEKHFTLSRRLPGPDHEISLEPDELDRAVTMVRQASAAQGRYKKERIEAEVENLEPFRKSVHAVRDIEVGSRITGEDVAVLRPATGLPPGAYEDVVGAEAVTDIAAGEPVTDETVKTNSQ